MADSASKNIDNIKGSQSSSSQEEIKNENKGKRLADFLTEFPRTDFFKEKLSEAMKIIASSKAKQTEKEGVKGSLQEEWDDPMVLELEQLLSLDLGFAFRGAIKKIVEFGYTEEVAQWAVLSSGTYFGLKDTETNIVNGALAYLKEEKLPYAQNLHVFKDLNSVVSYAMLEMVSVLREMKPDLSVAEAIWYLLICDSNLFLLCSAKVDSSMEKVILGNESKVKPSDKLPNIQFGDVTFEPKSITQTEEKPSGSIKVGSASKRDMLKQKTLLFEKNYKGRMLKSALKPKVNTSESSISNYEEKKASLETSLKNLEDHYAKTPYDSSLKTRVPRDERDEVLLVLLNKMKEMEMEKENWSKWANEKVMQAARRLGKDQKELKKLKADKEEAEKLLSDKKLNEENTGKRMVEFEHILADIKGHVEMSKALIAKSMDENRELKKGMSEKMKEAVAAFEEIKAAEVREQDLLKKLQEKEKMKNSFFEDLMKMKAFKEGVECDLNKDKSRLKQEEGRLAQIMKEKERLMKLVESIRSEREQMIAAAKIDSEVTVKKSEDYKKKIKEEIKKMEAEISEVKMKAEAEKIAELRQSITSTPKVTKRLAVFEEIYGEGDEYDECVMCLNNERTVVFLPCSHQVVCGKCNELHEKQGMKECPACRTPITRRIATVFAL